MRKQFISDVSHELKTPIALIQGYSEGLIENVNNDEESRKFYADVILDEKNIKVEFKETGPIYVIADDFYIEQVFKNYFTNAIKNVKPINGNKKIKISIKNLKDKNKIRVCVFNSGDQISKENLARIWTRFYKVDKSRNRNSGGTGIGLALVKAIMNQYGNDFGVTNKKDGVEFYFEVTLNCI